MAKPLVSVVIPTYKRHGQLTRLLASLAESDYPAESMEVIIVDNGNDLEAHHIDHAWQGAVIVKPGKNLWSNGARRVGTEASHGQYVFHVDDDNVLGKSCISELVGALEQHPDLGVVGPIMLVDDTDEVLSIGARISPYGIIEYVHKGRKIQELSLPNLVYGFDYLHNAIMIRRNVLKEIAFDDSNFPHNWAESDFGLRVGAAGYKQACVTSAVERHFGGYDGPLTRIGPQQTYDQAKSRILFRRRHMAAPSQLAKFWLVVFPASTVVYSWMILRSGQQQKLQTLRSYLKGTADGIKQPLTRIPAPRVAPQLKAASE